MRSIKKMEVRLRAAQSKLKKNIVESLAKSRDPGTGMFIDKLKDIIYIFNHTGEICCDEKTIYLMIPSWR